jgi:hypothetical protein
MPDLVQPLPFWFVTLSVTSIAYLPLYETTTYKGITCYRWSVYNVVATRALSIRKVSA